MDFEHLRLFLLSGGFTVFFGLWLVSPTCMLYQLFCSLVVLVSFFSPSFSVLMSLTESRKTKLKEATEIQIFCRKKTTPASAIRVASLILLLLCFQEKKVVFSL